MCSIVGIILENEANNNHLVSKHKVEELLFEGKLAESHYSKREVQYLRTSITAGGMTLDKEAVKELFIRPTCVFPAFCFSKLF